MRRACLLCTALLAFIAAAPGSTQDPAIQDPLVVRYVHYQDTVPVGSPNVLVGLAASGARASADTRRITVFVPPSGPDSLCIELISDNGRVGAGFSQRRPPHAGRHLITLPDELADHVRAYGPARLALLVQLSRNCEDDARELIVPAAWGTGGSPHQLRLLLNPQRVVRVSVTKDDAEPPSACTRLGDARQLTYDYACAVDVSNFIGYRTLTVWRTPPTGPRRALAVPIWVPDGG